MTDESTSESTELSRIPKAAPPPPPKTSPGPPPRPPVTTGAPPPVPPITGPSKLMRTARWVWGLSYLAGIVALFVAFLRRTDQFGRVRSVIDDLDPGRDAETVDRIAAIAFWGTFGALAFFLLLELLLRGRAERKAGARWLLLLVLLVHTSVAVVLVSFVALGAEGTPTAVLVFVELGLAAVALLVTAIAARINRRRQRAPTPEPAPERRRR